MNTPNTELERIKITFEISCLRGLDTSRKAKIKYALDTALQTYAKQEVERVLLSLLEDTTFADVTSMLTEEVVLVSVIEQHLKEIPAKE